MCADACIVCHGRGCRTTFDDITFRNCVLVVLSGAQVTLKNPLFTGCFSSTSGVSLFVHGSGSRALVWGGAITGGHQAATVQAGAHLEATACTIHDTLCEGIVLTDAGTGSMDSCVVSGSQCAHGLMVSGVGSRAKLARCQFLRNHSSGVAAFGGGSVTADSCTSSENKVAGFQVDGDGSRVYTKDCSSFGDLRGCQATNAGSMHAQNVEVCGSTESGYLVGTGGEGVLQDCSAVQCGVHGVYARGDGSRLEVRGGELRQNSNCGVVADQGSLVEVSECCSSRNKKAGFVALNHATMVVGNSSSNGDSAGCCAEGGGKLVLEGVREDGLLKSGVMT
jgi:hypothetical protein